MVVYTCNPSTQIVIFFFFFLWLARTIVGKFRANLCYS